MNATSTVFAYVISTTTNAASGIDPVITSALINTAGFIGAGLLGAGIAYISTRRQNEAEDKRLKATLVAEAERMASERIFQARKTIYVNTISFFNICLIKRGSGQPMHTDMADIEKSSPIMAAASLFSSREISDKCGELTKLFIVKSKDITHELHLENQIKDLMRKELGIE